MDARLENRRNDTTAKCANCAHWSERDSADKPWGICDRRKMDTPDLATCTGWELHVVHDGRVLRADETIDDK